MLELEQVFPNSNKNCTKIYMLPFGFSCKRVRFLNSVINETGLTGIDAIMAGLRILDRIRSTEKVMMLV